MMSLLDAHEKLSGKTAVIIGGAKGIGRAISLKLAAAGVNIASCDKDGEASAALRSEIAALGGRALSVCADVRSPAEMVSFLDQMEEQTDRVDILVNVPGGTVRRPFMDSNSETDAENMRLNFGYILDVTRRVVPIIRRGGQGGSIINFTTIEAHRGAAGYAVYSAAKGAVTNFTRALAVELGSDQIRVNIIAPDSSPSTAYINWDGQAGERIARYGALSDAAKAAGHEIYIPQKRAPSIEDLANAALFLASELSRAITGQVLHVDGGTSASMGFLEWPFGDGHGPAPGPETLHRLYP